MTKESMNFSGKTALVTGAAGGMGQAIAGALVQAGANVAAVDARPIPDFSGAGACRRFIGSVADWPFVSATVAAAKDRFGRIDYLVNAAGVLWFERDRSVVDIDLAVWDQVLAINLTGCAHTVKAVVPVMRATGGAMVHFSTIQCLRGDDRPQDAYQVSKAGLLALSKSVAVQFAGVGIRSNCILPGPTLSPMQARWQANPQQRQAAADAVPLGRVGSVDDMAAACLFLLSDRAAYITGTELIVDGGLTARP